MEIIITNTTYAEFSLAICDGAVAYTNGATTLITENKIQYHDCDLNRKLNNTIKLNTSINKGLISQTRDTRIAKQTFKE